MSAGKIRVTFEADDAAGMFEFCKSFVEGEGYTVEKKLPLHAKETAASFCARVGIHIATFCRRMAKPECPTNFECERGPMGRLIWLRASRELEEFMKPLSESSE